MAYATFSPGLNEGDREGLTAWLRSAPAPAGLVQRTWIVLLAADAVPHKPLADRVVVSTPTVRTWRRWYESAGLDGLGDLPQSGRPKTIDDRETVAATLVPPPKRLSVTHWFSRLLGARLKIDYATVARAWRSYRVRPWRCETFKFSTDPELVGKVQHVVGLYLALPEGDRASRWRAYRRPCGTTALLAALEIATGTVTAAVKPRHHHQEFLAFLKQVAPCLPGRRGAHGPGQRRHPEALRDPRLARGEPTLPSSFHPTSGSWLNLVEVWFGIIQRQAIARCAFSNVRELNATIRVLIDCRNEPCHPFVWTRTAAEILTSAQPKTTSATSH